MASLGLNSGLLFLTHAVAYAWALWAGDWLRAPHVLTSAGNHPTIYTLTAAARQRLRSEAGAALALYYVLAGLIGLAYLGIILAYRSTEKVLHLDSS